MDDDGKYDLANPHDFRTPLWYYVLKEAEIEHGGKQLGSLGGRIIGEVIATGIWLEENSFINPTFSNGWTPIIPTTTDASDPANVSFQDIIDYVLTYESTLPV